jgi:hypothetical protein
MCLDETYSRVRVGKHLSDMFAIKKVSKQGDGLPSMIFFFNFALQYAIRRVQVNQDGLKLNGTYQLTVCVHDDNISEGCVHTIKNRSFSSC